MLLFLKTDNLHLKLYVAFINAQSIMQPYMLSPCVCVTGCVRELWISMCIYVSAFVFLSLYWVYVRGGECTSMYECNPTQDLTSETCVCVCQQD